VIVIEPGSFKTAIWSKVEAMDLRRYAGTPYESVLDRFRRAALRVRSRRRPPTRWSGRCGERSTPGARRSVSSSLRTVARPHAVVIPDRWLDWLIWRFLWRGVHRPPS